jgi:hypothetical protein
MNIKALKNSFERNVLLKKENVTSVVKINDEFNTWHQRLALGIASISTQPFYDYFNKNVDQDTREYSAMRTVAKIIVGTTEGCLVRALAIKYGGRYVLNKFKKPEFAENLIKSLEKVKKKNSTFKKLEENIKIWSTEIANNPEKFTKVDIKALKNDKKLYQLSKFINEAGNVISIVAAFVAALLIDIPMTNKVLNLGMDLLFPGHNKDGGSK